MVSMLCRSRRANRHRPSQFTLCVLYRTRAEMEAGTLQPLGLSLRIDDQPTQSTALRRIPKFLSIPPLTHHLPTMLLVSSVNGGCEHIPQKRF